ncbi:carbohydrate deacetylase [uncultured Anaerococcus sp.]|uniref:carbohydrate deacetylase n=1 Tax=uncultured Anaerococcus sp. TaxID=293428 RepID=UPI00288A3375|nr:carbohydrate deacetylase [uncultured Anaerococcus sp.]
MGKLIINADDFGYSRGVNAGIIEAYSEGLLTSTTIMAGMPGFDEAVELAKKHKGLGVGVHLTLTCGYPVSSNLKTIVDESGLFMNLSFYEDSKFESLIDLDEVYAEWKSQIEKVLESGIKPTHLDSHHHVNNIGKIKDVFVKLAREYSLPVRNNFDVPSDIKTTSKLIDYFDRIGFVKKIWRGMNCGNLIKDCNTYDSIEIMCHPAYVDNYLLTHSSFHVDRTSTLKELKDVELKDELNKNKIEMINFSQI